VYAPDGKSLGQADPVSVCPYVERKRAGQSAVFRTVSLESQNVSHIEERFGWRNSKATDDGKATDFATAMKNMVKDGNLYCYV
jgi:hypothetical protein